MNKAKVPCNLITGQERDEIDGAQHTSVTVEMADVSSEYQCAVIDEIQVPFLSFISCFACLVDKVVIFGYLPEHCKKK